MAPASLEQPTYFQSSATILVLLLFVAISTQAQILTPVYSFTGQNDGRSPVMGVITDRAGNLYGGSGTVNSSVIYKLSHRDPGWTFTPLHDLTQREGSVPVGLTFGPDGALYGVTSAGGNAACQYNGGCGTIFRLTPPPMACATSNCVWPLTVLHTFKGSPDGGVPWWGASVTFDGAGSLYGTTYEGGKVTSRCPYGCGVVYKLTHSTGGWTESVIYRFSGPDGAGPQGPVIFDRAGNLYGTTSTGGSGNAGTVFRLAPSGTGWVKATLYNFHGSDGASPMGSLAIDDGGNLYGATQLGGTGSCGDHGPCGTVFVLSPSNGEYQETVLYSFGDVDFTGYPSAGITIDSTGNLYGTTAGYGAQPLGNIFESFFWNGNRSYVSLHDFTGGSDGANSYSNVTIDANGKLFGTTSLGGQSNENCFYGCGVIWELNP